MTLYSIVMVLCSTMAQLGDPAIPTTKGRVISVAEDTVTIAVRAGEEPVLGDKIEIYIELPDLDGIAVLATGRVTQVTETSAIARLESKTGRIGKNQLVRVTPSKLARSSNKPIADTVTEPMPTPPPSTGRPPVPAPINADLTRAVGTALPAPLPENLGLGGVKGRPLNSLSSEPTNGDFAAPVRSFQQAVLSIGNPARGAWGTGFVISRAKRLVATNAHVADIAKIAVLNESRTSYKVEKIWYHGGVIRAMDDGKTLIQSANPADGKVDPECSDIAILQLEAVGPELPAEVVLASPEETFGIMGSRVGILGYPGYQHDQLIQPDVFASATFVQGSVSRMTGLRHVPNAAMVQRQSVAYDARTYGGFSGSPVFLSNGRVVAVHNHSHRDAGERTLAQGLRVDVLWELLHREKLCDCVSGEPLGLPEQIAFTLAPDPRVEKLRRAQRQLAQSADLILHDEFEEAQHILKDAKLLLPDYWRLYWQSSRNITHYLGDEWEDLSAQNKTSWIRESLKELRTADTLYRQSFGTIYLRLVLDQARELISLGRLGSDKASFQQAVAMLDDVVRKTDMGEQRAYFLALRGSAKTDLNDLAGALSDFNDAIRLTPNAGDFYKNRAWVWTKLNRPAEAARDRQRFAELLEALHHHHHD